MTKLLTSGCWFISIILILYENITGPLDMTEPYVELNSFKAHLNKRLPVLMKKYKVPGVSLAIINDGKVAWYNSYGYADLETGRKMTDDNYYRVESISKSVTAWGVMRLVEQGLLDPDRPVRSYFKNWVIPDSDYSVEKVTIRLLLANCAGFPLGTIGARYSPFEEMPSLEERLSVEAILKQEPGLSFIYSNTGFNILELLVEEVTGRDFSEYMSNEVLIPLGMYNSTFRWSENFNPSIPTGYDLKGNPIPVYIYPERASGGLFASVIDIAAFVAAGMNNLSDTGSKVLNIKSINEIYTPTADMHGYLGLAFDHYGSGHFIEYLSNGNIAAANGGQGTGWMTHFHSVPATGDGIVILTNSQRSWPLISHILTDWAEWRGFSGIGMSKIIPGYKILQTSVALLLLVLSVQLWRLTKGIYSGYRKFNLLSKSSRFISFVQLCISFIIISGLIWAATRKYLFVSSVFPGVSEWLGYSLLAAAIILLLSAIFPYNRNNPLCV